MKLQNILSVTFKILNSKKKTAIYRCDLFVCNNNHSDSDFLSVFMLDMMIAII